MLPVEVWPPAAPYHEAFVVLAAGRRQGMGGAEALAYSEILAYAQANGFAETMADLEEFVMLIQAQDAAVLTELARARQKKGA